MKKIAIVMLIVLMSLTAVFAQGGKEAVTETGKAVTTITWWSFPTLGTDGAAEKELIAAFEAANPDVKVKLEMIDFTSGPNKLTAAIEGGAAPDVLFDAPGRIIEYGRNGKLVSLDDMFTSELKADVSSAALLEACSDGTTYWMYPQSSSPFCMSINKEMWEKAGAFQYVNTQGARTWTTENFIKAMEALGKAGYVGINVYCGGQGGDQGTRALVANLYGATIADAKNTQYTMNSPEGAKALALLKDLYKKGNIDAGLGIAAADELQLYQKGMIASSICWGTSAAKNYKSDSFTQFTLPFPSDDGIPELEYLVNGFCVFDNKDNARAEAAKRLVAFICDDPTYGPISVKAAGAFPVRNSFGNLYEGNDEYRLLSDFTKYYGGYYNTMKGFAAMRTQWWNMLQFIFTESKSVETALADYAKVANANL